MHDIKTNSYADVPMPHERPRKTWKRVVRWSVGALIAIIVLSYVWSFLAGATAWRAVFLTNNQVYFGHFYSVPFSSAITLRNVYYLQISAGANQDLSNASQSQFKLVRLGNEIHGPTDEMVIPMNQILFWETLRSDSAIVNAIKSLNP